jgi:transposase
VVDLLEDAENDIPMALRTELINEWRRYRQLGLRLKEAERARDLLCKQHESCQRLNQLGGVGPVNAIGLYLALGDRGSSFKNGREAATCIGTTPKQYSTGDEVTMLGISKKCANKRLRSNLIQGARSVIKALKRREPKNAQEAWLKAVIERRGEGRAAVAWANKTIRVAWAMLHHGDNFKSHLNLA